MPIRWQGTNGQSWDPVSFWFLVYSKKRCYLPLTCTFWTDWRGHFQLQFFFCTCLVHFCCFCYHSGYFWRVPVDLTDCFWGRSGISNPFTKSVIIRPDVIVFKQDDFAINRWDGWMFRPQYVLFAQGVSLEIGQRTVSTTRISIIYLLSPYHSSTWSSLQTNKLQHERSPYDRRGLNLSICVLN